MTRTAAREIAIQLCFAAASADLEPGELAERFFDRAYYESLGEEQELFREYPDADQMAYILRLTSLASEHRAEIDALIERYAKGWRIERISRTALAVLRCAVCEIFYMEDIPNAAAINEAVELCKGYDGPDTVSFVNGVLGGIMRGELGETSPAEAPAQE
jgi:transcription antitermination factor NusB